MNHSRFGATSRRSASFALMMFGRSLASPGHRLTACIALSVAGFASADCGARTPIFAGDAAGPPTATPPCEDAATLAPNGVLFGGYGQIGDYLSDTWTWDGAAWSELQVAGPSGRVGAAMTSLCSKVILFGGNGDSNFGDTWSWNGSKWTQLDVSGPSPRNGAAMAALGNSVVLFGGESTGQFFSDTWTWDGSIWTQLSVAGPPPRSNAVMAQLDGKLVLFGGLSMTGSDDADTWTWDGTSWVEVPIAGPSARNSAAMAPLEGKLVLFAGIDDAGVTLSDTWTWDATAWTELALASPPARESAVMVPVGGVLVLFGGESGENLDASFDGTLSDTWTWDGTAWTLLAVTPHPGSREGAVMASP